MTQDKAELVKLQSTLSDLKKSYEATQEEANEITEWHTKTDTLTDEIIDWHKLANQ